MPQRKVDSFQTGGVDSRSNPTNYPAERLLRCKNFSPLVSGQLRLRYGYTKPIQAGGTGGAIHSAVYYEQYAGHQFALFGQGTALNQLDLQTAIVSPVATLSNGNKWGHFRSANRIFLGNGTDFDSWDGATLRAVGIRAPNSTETAGVVATWDGSDAGSFASTNPSLNNPGYQFFMVYFNPVTGAVGNRAAIGAVLQVHTTGFSVVLSGLPDLSGVNAEWVKGIGRTNDGGQVPYWLVDSNGNRIVAGNTASVATLTVANIDPTQELPFRNGVPPALTMFAKVGSKIFGAQPGDINLHYTEDDTDLANGNFVGVPAEAWPPDNIEPFPTGEVPTAIHGYLMEGWFYSKNYLAIWSLFMFQQGQNPWRVVWNVGCAGQRAWVDTPYGPHWFTTDKQLMGYNGSGPIPVSEEYEAALLQKFGDQYVSQVELGYYRNPELGIDRVYIKGLDKNGAPLIVHHDFKLRDYRSQIAQGYETLYGGMVPSTLVGAGYTPRQNLRDLNGRERLWTGAADGNFYQLEDGNSDNGMEYTGDAIFLISAGDGKPLLKAIEWQGDSNVRVSFSTKAKLSLIDFENAETKIVEVDNPDNRYEAQVDEEARWIYARFQLTSHHADGDFTISDPPFVPIPTYGIINVVTPKFGRGRPEAA